MTFLSELILYLFPLTKDSTEHIATDTTSHRQSGLSCPFLKLFCHGHIASVSSAKIHFFAGHIRYYGEEGDSKTKERPYVVAERPIPIWPYLLRSGAP